MPFLGRQLVLVGIVLSCIALMFLGVSGVGISSETLPLSQTHPRAIHELGEIDSEIEGLIVIQLVVESESNSTTTYSVKADCGCISVVDTIELSPKERTAIPIEISVPNIPGPFRRVIRVLPSDGNLNEMSLVISGTVLPSSRLRTNVQEVDFGRFKNHSVKKVSLRRYNSMPVKYKHIKGPSYISVVGVDSTELEHRHKTTLTLFVDGSHLRPGGFQEIIYIMTEDENHSIAGVRILGTKL